MSEVQAAPATPDTAAAPSPQPAAPTKLAGKYDTPEQLGNAIREAHKMLGLEEIAADKPVWGEGSKLGDINQAEWHYNQLNKLISRGVHKQAAPEPAPETPADPAPAPAKPSNPKEVIAAAGFTEESLRQEIEASGDLSPSTYAKIVATGVTEAEARAEVAKAKANIAAWKEGDALAGSREQHESLRKWATSNLKGDDAERMNYLSANPKTYGDAVKFMQEKFNASIGAESSGSPVVGRAATGGSPGIQTRGEFSAVMSRVLRGDMAAIKMLEQTPDDKIREWSKT